MMASPYLYSQVLGSVVLGTLLEKQASWRRRQCVLMKPPGLSGRYPAEKLWSSPKWMVTRDQDR